MKPVLGVTLLVLCGCGAGKSGDQPAASQQAVESILLERTRCFGTCPDYRVVISRDGTARLSGGQFAARHGEYHAQLDQATFTRVAETFQAKGFFAMDSAYVENVTDLPTFVLATVGTGGPQQVRCYGFKCPPAFHELAALVDSVTEGLPWDTLPGVR